MTEVVQQTLMSLRDLVDHHFNADKKPVNLFKLLALLAAVYGAAKVAQIRGLIEADGVLKQLPAMHGVTVPGSSRPGQTVVYRHHMVAHPLPLPSRPSEGVESIYHSFFQAAELHGEKPCLGERKKTLGTSGEYSGYQWLSYGEVAEKATRFGSGLKHLTGLQRQGFLGLYSANRVQWVIAETAANAYSLVTIPLYDTLGAGAAQFIIRQSGITTVVCSSQTFDRLLECAAECPSLQHVVVMDDNDQELLGGSGERTLAHMREEAARHRLSLHSMAEVEAYGCRAAMRLPHDPPAASDVATLMYTSGTTGDPKGAILTHGNFAACLSAVEIHLNHSLGPDDVHISYLPLAHVFERLVLMLMLAQGASVGFYRGNILWLLEDIALLRPTVFPSVPRLLNRIHDKIVTAVASLSPLKRRLFAMGYEAKRQNLYSVGATVHPFWDQVLFNKFSGLLGGRLRWILTGAAPISPQTLEFLRIVLCCRVMEGYGQTEGTGVGTVSLHGDVSLGHVGPPSPAAELKLVDVPEMEYLSTDQPHPRGEVCIRGPAVFKGYYLQPEKTAEALDEEGWLHSGDIGEMLPNGCLRIIDRKKNLFKLAQGEYVAPEKIENILISSPYIAQAFVHGDSLQPYLVAVIVPDQEVVEIWAHSNSMPHHSFAELCRTPELRDLVFADVLFRCKEANLGGFEIPKIIHLSDQLFTVENDILTPTFKLKRNVARKAYQQQILAMYSQPPLLPPISSSL